MSALSAGAYTATLLVMVNVMKGGGRAPPTLTSQANFTLMTECTPESRRYYSVYSVDGAVTIISFKTRERGFYRVRALLARQRFFAVPDRIVQSTLSVVYLHRLHSVLVILSRLDCT